MKLNIVKMMEVCREVHFQGGQHVHTLTVWRTVYRRQDDSEFVRRSGRQAPVTREYGYATYEVACSVTPVV